MGRQPVTWRNMGTVSGAGALAVAARSGQNIGAGIQNIGKAFDEYGDNKIQQETDLAVNALRAAAPEDRQGLMQKFADSNISMDSKQIGVAADKLDQEARLQERFDYSKERDVTQDALAAEALKFNQANVTTDNALAAKRFKSDERSKNINIVDDWSKRFHPSGEQKPVHVSQAEAALGGATPQQSIQAETIKQVPQDTSNIIPKDVIRASKSIKTGAADHVGRWADGAVANIVGSDLSPSAQVKAIISMKKQLGSGGSKAFKAAAANALGIDSWSTKNIKEYVSNRAIEDLRGMASAEGADLNAVSGEIDRLVREEGVSRDVLTKAVEGSLRGAVVNFNTDPKAAVKVHEFVGDLTDEVNNPTLDTKGKLDLINAATKAYTDHVDGYNSVMKKLNLTSSSMKDADSRFEVLNGLVELRKGLVGAQESIIAEQVAASKKTDSDVKAGAKLKLAYEKMYNTKTTSSLFPGAERDVARLVARLKKENGIPNEVAHKAIQESMFIDTRFFDELTSLDGKLEGSDAYSKILENASAIIASNPNAFMAKQVATGDAPADTSSKETEAEALSRVANVKKAVNLGLTVDQFSKMKDNIGSASDEEVLAMASEISQSSEKGEKALSAAVKASDIAIKTPLKFAGKVLSSVARMPGMALEPAIENIMNIGKPSSGKLRALKSTKHEEERIKQANQRRKKLISNIKEFFK